MKLRDNNIIFTYQVIGIIIFLLGLKIYNYWFLAVVPLSIYLLIRSRYIIQGKIDSLLFYIYSLFSVFLNFININFSVIPFSIISNLIFSKSDIKTINRIYKIFRYISYLGFLIIFVNIILSGRYFGSSPFLFSKNMIILPFMPFVVFYHFNYRRIVDNILYLSILVLFLSTLSVGNFLMTALLFIALFLPDNSFISILKNINFNISKITRKKIKKLIFALIVFFVMGIFLFSLLSGNSELNFSSAEFQASKEKILSILDTSLYFFNDLMRVFPRFDILIQYINSLSLAQIFTGNPNITFDLYVPASIININNPHNSLILAHMNMGIFGLIFYTHISLRIIYIFLKKNIKLSIIAFAILLRSFTDIILVLSGFSSFVIFFLLFNPYIYSKNTDKNKFPKNIDLKAL